MIKKMLIGIGVFACLFGITDSVQAQESFDDKIHFINVLESGSDAIILESNGHYAMIDTGEDYDFPEEEEIYPFRAGITTSSKQVLTDRVLRHLKEMGVQKLDFILLTHVHSDHTGNADEIMNQYPVGRVYMKRYDDKRITNANRLWDNQYVYDNVWKAAKKKGIPVIQDISDKEAHFTFGDMDIQLYNYENEYSAPGILKPVWDDNSNSIISVITVNGKKIFLGGDLDNVYGAEDKYAPLIGKVDMMKLNHHGENSNSNQAVMLETLRPTVAVVTNNWKVEGTPAHLLNSMGSQIVYASSKEYDATVFEISQNGFVNISNTYQKIPPFSAGWFKDKDGNNLYLDPDESGNYTIAWKQINQKWYYFNSKGILLKNQWKMIRNKYYYFTETGVMASSWLKQGGDWYYLDSVNGDMHVGWLFTDNNWYYLLDNGVMKTGWLRDGENWYYLTSSGAMATGWTYDGTNWYYLKSSGEMATGWLNDEGTWYYLDKASGAMKIGWFRDGENWYYLTSSGAMATGWTYDGTNWYYLKSSGTMVNGWLKEGTTWYYLDIQNGDMKIGWFQVGNKWYYTDRSGALVVNTTINGYHLNQNGEWVH